VNYDSKEYFSYLKNNFDLERNTQNELDSTCSRPDLRVIEEYLKMLKLSPNQEVLEVGCGLGRVLERLEDKFKVLVSGVDISNNAVLEAKKNFPHRVNNIKTSDSTSIDFSSNFFNSVICWGVFDLTDQFENLLEMVRVLKVEGRLLLTGRVDNYLDDDNDAYIAEVNARKKKVPIKYTDYDKLLSALNEMNCLVVKNFFFQRRGHFMDNNYTTKRPERFLDYCLIIEKKSVNTTVPLKKIKIHSDFSKTWRSRNE
jgi:ubiquinone/menaquinone biosynthesis C-methylase UbiE